jgi:hypothetical protein
MNPSPSKSINSGGMNRIRIEAWEGPIIAEAIDGPGPIGLGIPKDRGA